MTISDLIIAHGINMSRDSALLSAAASPDMSHVGGSSAGDEGDRWQRSDGFGTSRHGSVV